MRADTLLEMARRLSRPRGAHGVGSFRRTIEGREVQITYTVSTGEYEVAVPSRVLATGPRRAVVPQIEALLGGELPC